MIDRSLIEDMFAKADTHRHRWNIRDSCLWSYFFSGEDRSVLMELVDHLAKQNYTFAGTLEPDPEDDHPILFVQLDRVESHTVETLIARNIALSAVADDFCGAVYDGMEVGPAK
ncbi:MAG TPA: ribonuclease E inhibitor RraB [Tepidisphaeraceae bacterium]|jgi:hypothetical protein